MPPRIPRFPCLKALEAALPPANGRQIELPARSFSSYAAHQAKGSKAGHQHRYRDPYVVAQARARRAANISKQETLQSSRAKALGDPVRGVETDFLKSFDVARDQGAKGEGYLNHFLTRREIDEQLDSSKRLVEPAPLLENDAEHQRIGGDIYAINKDTMERFNAAHLTVEEAVKRITAIDNGNSKDRLRINVARCVETFGRHNTDKKLPQRSQPTPLGPGGAPLLDHPEQKLPLKNRKGPDTGSSEVQIAILTAKIRNLANHMDRVGNSDKMNKRNLRLLVHKRQRLLQYLRRKERAGPRWQKCIETLGLTEGTWRGEITL